MWIKSEQRSLKHKCNDLDHDGRVNHPNARDYNPTLGQFLERDPIGYASGTTALYTYAEDDPVNKADPSGLGDLPPLPPDYKTPGQLLSLLRTGKVAPLEYLHLLMEIVQRDLLICELSRKNQAQSAIDDLITQLGAGPSLRYFPKAVAAAKNCLVGGLTAEAVTGGGGVEVPFFGLFASTGVGVGGCVTYAGAGLAGGAPQNNGAPPKR